MTSKKGPADAVRRAAGCLERIGHANASINAVLTVTPEAAMEAAEACDVAAAEGRWLGLLHGMPMVVKDNIDTAGTLTTSGAKFLARHVPNRDATVVRRLRAAGAVILGKANLHELCFGIRSNNSVAGQVRNPWAPDRIPGGSSGGSAAAVAAGLCAGALGSDTGGSVRLPAAMCGVAGLRPTWGRVPCTGSMPVSASQDTIGPIARHVGDVARIFAAIAGHDAGDPVSSAEPLENFLPRLGDPIEGVRIGIPRAGYFDGADDSVAEAVNAGARELERLGARLIDVDVPGMAEMHHHATVVIFSDACAVHRARLESSPEDFDSQVYARMRTGLEFSGVDYAEAMRARERWKQTLAALFGEVDALLSPTVHTRTPPIEDDRSLLEATRDATRNTYAGAFGQIPGLSVPCGFAADGLPVGMQIEGRWWREPLLLRIGHAFQQVTQWHRAEPPAA